jgi:hypothetical protein
VHLRFGDNDAAQANCLTWADRDTGVEDNGVNAATLLNERNGYPDCAVLVSIKRTFF